ncbi:hypothetical protein DACRYDRAFT_119618 [Dacryopinax primogenitus]|uniref:Uncharacterized protein n=1 Tax=Dacryopinax primogenitus (strain DJM 731) TaxID=1858805 RepID=M5G043_DACPD|nr:uncharacterized protein DACRYDRAFT_119618 [Dacryopinax primogenitus]EJT97147.1 hypothetical protein DACRYDRAFT_119618 [Dacryopinax primogenitus]
MSKLRDNLPAGGRLDAERDLTNDFKAAALSITKLYKSSLAASASAWSAGYQAALSELWEKFSPPGDLDPPLMLEDIREWARARMDAIGAGGSNGELSDEDREKERERERDERGLPPIPPSKPSPKPEDVPDKTAATSEPGRVQIYTDSPQANIDDERPSLIRSPTTFAPTRTPFSSPSPVSALNPPTSTKTRSRRSHALRDTTASNPFPAAPTFAPALPGIPEFPFFPPAIFESTQPIQYGTGMKRRHDSADETGAGVAGRKARMRERGSGDSMDIDGERDKKRRR